MSDSGTALTTEPRRFGWRRLVVEAVWVLLVVVLAALVFSVRYQDPRRVATGDSFWYMRQALIFSGQSVDDATRESARLVCQDINRSAVDRDMQPTCKTYISTGFSPRYVAIFDSRPGYPLFAAPFVAVLGAWTGMMAATLLLALAAAALAYLAVWMATGLRLAGAVGSVLLFVLPSGFWMYRMLAESAVVAGCFAVLIATMLIWRGRPIGLALVVPALAWLFTVRSASGMAVTLVMLIAAVLTLIRRPSQVSRRGLLVTVGVAVAALALWSVLSAVLGLPSLNETIQDLATTHYRHPDIANPYEFLIQKNVQYWRGQIKQVLLAPVALIAALGAFAVLWMRMRSVAWMWILMGLIGIMMQVAHPARSEWGRMMLLINIPIACALGYGAALAIGRVRWPGSRKGLHPQPSPISESAIAHPVPSDLP